jgi:hypothetical protein
MASFSYEGVHSCEHCRDICIDNSASLTQSENAAIVLNTSPAKAVAQMKACREDFIFIPMTEDRIQRGLTGRCKLFTLLGDDLKRDRRDSKTPKTSPLFLVARIVYEKISLGYLSNLPLADIEELSSHVPI